MLIVWSSEPPHLILERYLLSKFAPTYATISAIGALATAGAHFAGAPDSGLVDALPILGLSATVVSAITFSTLAYDRELTAMYAAGISLLKVCLPAYCCSSVIPVLALLVGFIRHDLYHILAPAVAAIASSLIGISAAAVTASEFARREVGIVWLASLGVLIVFFLGEGKMASLGNHPVFDASCTIVMAGALLWFIWYMHYHLRELV